MTAFNLSATLNIVRLISNPQLCLPHLVIPTFNDLPVPLMNLNGKLIKAIVLDKDNCFAKNHDDRVWPDYEDKWNALRKAYPDAQLLIVSNSAGTNDDIDHRQAKIIEEEQGFQCLDTLPKSLDAVPKLWSTSRQTRYVKNHRILLL